MCSLPLRGASRADSIEARGERAVKEVSMAKVFAAEVAFKVAFNAPATATGWWGSMLGSGAAMSSDQTMAATFVDGETKVTTDDPDIARFDGYVTTTGSGTFKLRWAQSSSNGTATVLKKGSYLHALRVT